MTDIPLRCGTKIITMSPNFLNISLADEARETIKMWETKCAIAAEAIQIWLHCLYFDFLAGWERYLC